MVYVAGLLAGLLPFVAAFAAVFVFGFLLEAYGELAVIPAPVITFLLAAMASTRPWQLGVVTGLAVSCVALTFVAGPWALPLFVLPMVVAWGLGHLVARWRATHAHPTGVIDARGWSPGADTSPIVQSGLSSAGASAPPTTSDRDPRILIAALGPSRSSPSSPGNSPNLRTSRPRRPWNPISACRQSRTSSPGNASTTSSWAR